MGKGGSSSSAASTSIAPPPGLNRRPSALRVMPGRTDLICRRHSPTHSLRRASVRAEVPDAADAAAHRLLIDCRPYGVKVMFADRRVRVGAALCAAALCAALIVLFATRPTQPPKQEEDLVAWLEERSMLSQARQASRAIS